MLAQAVIILDLFHADCFPTSKLFLYILFPGLELNGECSGDFQWRSEHSAEPFGHRSLTLLLAYFSVFLPFAVFHLTPLSPATCLSKPSQSSLYLFAPSPHFSSCMVFPPFLLSLAPSLLDTGHARAATTLPVCLIKM